MKNNNQSRNRRIAGLAAHAAEDSIQNDLNRITTDLLKAGHTEAAQELARVSGIYRYRAIDAMRHSLARSLEPYTLTRNNGSKA